MWPGCKASEAAHYRRGRRPLSGGAGRSGRAQQSAPIRRWRCGWRPPEDIPALLTDLGGAQILAGDPSGAVATLDRAVQIAPTARAYFLRARAKELAGQTEAALADYNLASRTAFADATDLASGEAHLYRGILLYRRKDYARAEDEFASALNFDIPSALRPDAVGVASPFRCGLGILRGFARSIWSNALPSVSPYFPKAEAQAVWPPVARLAGAP